LKNPAEESRRVTRGNMGECPPSGWKKIHAPSIFTAIYKVRIIDLNFAPQHMKMHQNVSK